MIAVADSYHINNSRASAANAVNYKVMNPIKVPLSRRISNVTNETPKPFGVGANQHNTLKSGGSPLQSVHTQLRAGAGGSIPPAHDGTNRASADDRAHSFGSQTLVH